MAEQEATTTTSSDEGAAELMRKYLRLAYTFDQGAMTHIPPTPEMEEFGTTDEQLCNAIRASGVAKDHVAEKTEKGSMCMYSRVVGDWHHEFWSIFDQSSPPYAEHVVWSERWLMERKIHLTFERTLGEAASVFTSALMIVELLCHDDSMLTPARLEKKLVVELGSGTGVFGVVAGLLGVNIIMTDRAGVTEQIQRNVDKNTTEEERSHIRVEQLDWGTPTSLKGDIVVCSDCVYHAQVYDQLLSTLREVLTPQGHIVLTFERRHAANEARFLEMAQEYFHVNEEMGIEKIVEDVRLFKMTHR